MSSKRPKNPPPTPPSPSSPTTASSSSTKDEDNQLPIPPKHSSKKSNPITSSSSDDSDHHQSTVGIKSSKSTPLKRPLEVDQPRKDKTKKKKKKVSDLAAVTTASASAQEDGSDMKSGDDQQKPKLFQKVWTDEEEIVILKGLLSFKKKGMEVNKHGLFYRFIKDSLRPDLTQVQLQSKIRGLKKKYDNAIKNPNKPRPNPHEEKLFKLSKKVWGDGEGDDVVVQNNQDNSAAAAAASVTENKLKSNKIGETEARPTSSGPSTIKGSKSPNGSPVAAATPTASMSKNKLKSNKTGKTEARPTTSGPSTAKGSKLPNGSPVVEVEQEECVVGHGSEFIYLDQSLASPNLSVLPGPPPGLVEVFSKRGWNVMGDSKARGFDKRWRDVLIAESNAYLERIDLVREQTQAMLDALKSSDE